RARAASPQRRDGVAALLLHDLAHHPGPGKRGAAQGDAEPVEKAELDALHHIGRYVALARLGREARQRAGGIFEKRGLRAAHCIFLSTLARWQRSLAPFRGEGARAAGQGSASTVQTCLSHSALMLAVRMTLP